VLSSLYVVLSLLYVVVLSLYKVIFTLYAVLCLLSLYKVLLSLYVVAVPLKYCLRENYCELIYLFLADFFITVQELYKGIFVDTKEGKFTGNLCR